MLSTLLQAVLFSFLTDFYTLYDFLSQLVLNFSHLAPDVPCGWVSQSCLGILLCSFLSLPFVERRSKLTVQLYFQRDLPPLQDLLWSFSFSFFFSSSPLSVVLCELKSRFLGLEVRAGHGEPGHIIMNNNNDCLALLCSSQPIMSYCLCIPGLLCGAWCINDAQ